MTRYRLPDGIRDGEIEAEEVWGGCAGGRPEYQLAGGFTLLAPAGQGFPPVLLIPDPFAEPVELPLRLVCAATKDDTLEIAGPDDDHQIRLSILGLGSVYLDQRQARTAARALMSAADAAEKEQS